MMRYSDGLGGFYELNNFPGCNQIIVSNHAWIDPAKRGQGLGSKVHEQRLKQAKSLGYDYALCTVRSNNEPQIAILKKFGWTRLDSFLNKETGHIVCLYGKKLEEV